jgi:hypothetical protein
MRKKLSLVSVLLLLLLASCQTLFVSSVPAWAVKKPANSKKWVYFLGTGTASELRLARNKAYLAALQEAGEFVGADIAETYYRELTDTGRVEQLGMEIYRQWQTSNEGNVECYVLFRASRSSMEGNWSDEYRETIRKESEIDRLLALSLEQYKANNDVDSVNSLLSALAISLSYSPTNPRYQSREILDLAISRLEKIEIKIKNSNPATGAASVKLTRSYGLLYPPVKNAPVTAEFTTYEPLGYKAVSRLSFLSDRRGELTFSPLNPYTSKSGRVTFRLDLDEELSKIAAVAPREYLQRLDEVISSVNVSFEYSLAPNADAEKVGIAFAEFGEEGERLETHYARAAFTECFEQEDIRLTTLELDEEELEYIIDEAREKYPEIEQLIWARVGILDSADASDETLYSVGGEVYLINLISGRIEQNETLAKVAVWAKDGKAAVKDGFEKFGKLLAVKFISHF